MEQTQNSLLQVGFQIDQHISATKQIELGQGRVLDEILDGENCHFANLFFDLIAVALLQEKSREPRRRDVGDDTAGIDFVVSSVYGICVDIGAENLHAEVLFERVHAFAEYDRDRINLLAA